MIKPQDVVLAFWQCMHSNDFLAASDWLAEEFECFLPQSGETIRCGWDYAMINIHFPSFGPWSFEVESLLADGERVVSDVKITDGIQVARVVTFSTVLEGKIVRQVEYWPESFAAAEWRKKWTSQRTDSELDLMPIERKHCIGSDIC